MAAPPQIQNLTFHLISSFRDNYRMTSATPRVRGRLWGTPHSAFCGLRILL